MKTTDSDLMRKDAYLAQLVEVRSSLFALLDMYGVAEYYYTNAHRDCNKYAPTSWIIEAFRWRDTPQGSTFWNEIDRQWFKMCVDREIRLAKLNQKNLL